ncbi:U3 small nucleolar ribonucleoprotein protein MPP10 [Spodoptera frugiperda]|uniref:U3 small nucleolar ribonucleoprotein protein MPP10 n=1 Tax=Spodoptera frugiperda TaxID=7108 RepID=A0A9R0DJG5_SPOFR|nr:U3 small nucleolar ribonucleoprotein protein MPP10 [Spodoptera frugiperda]
MACPVLEDITGKFNSFTEKPVKFLAVQSDLKDDIKNLVKSLYDYTKTQETVDKKVKKAALPEMIVQDFDEEQIWQQIELQNTECWDQLVWDVANCMSSKTNLEFPVTISKEDSNEKNNVDSDKLISEDEEHSESEKSDQNEDEDEINEKPKKKKTTAPKSKGKSSIVDDQFFKLQDMEKFLLHEERNEGKKPREDDSDEESIDLFNDIDDDDGSNDEEGGKEAMYSDFFNQDEENGDEYENGEVDENGDLNDEEVDEEMDAEEDQSDQEPPKKDNKKKVKFALADSSSDDDDESVDSDTPTNNNKIQPDEKKSEFEQRQLRLKQQIEKLEQKTLSEAPWQLKGEVDALKRPQNSLLEEVVDFDLTSRPPPIITEQTTVTLEELIRRRIKDKAWDDVEKKEKPVDDQLSFRKNVVLDHAKSKLSLAQVYEAEYLKQKQAASGEVEEEKEPEAHTEIRETMNKLFAKLDALCHYHYTPKAPQAEVKIVSNTPAISMEEVAPVATSDATLLAPEEVKRKRKGELMSKEERTQTDKNRERRKKKKLQRQKGKVAKVTEHRNTEKGAVATCPKTSKAFFEQLTNDSRSLIKKNNVKNKGQ